MLEKRRENLRDWYAGRTASVAVPVNVFTEELWRCGRTGIRGVPPARDERLAASGRARTAAPQGRMPYRAGLFGRIAVSNEPQRRSCLPYVRAG